MSFFLNYSLAALLLFPVVSFLTITDHSFSMYFLYLYYHHCCYYYHCYYYYYPHAFLKRQRGYCNRLCPSVRLSIMLSPPKPFVQIQLNLVCELFTWIGCTTSYFLAPPPWALGRCKLSFKFNTKLVSKIFIPNFVCVLTNERYKTYETGFSFCCLGHVPGVGIWGIGGAQGVNCSSIMVMWHIKLTGMTSKTECKLSFYPRVKLVTLGWSQKVKYH